MNLITHPASMVAEKAFRYLRKRHERVPSTRLMAELLATRVSNETEATDFLKNLFKNDRRLAYRAGGWTTAGKEAAALRMRDAKPAPTDPPAVFAVLAGARDHPSRKWRLTRVLTVRIDRGVAVEAAGGDLVHGAEADYLRRSILDTLGDDVLVTHDPPGALVQLERWLGTPLGSPVSLRLLARDRLRLPSGHSLEELAARLGLSWRESGDPLDAAEVMVRALEALRNPGESLSALQEASSPDRTVIRWQALAFDREFLRSLPRSPGTYRFLDREGNLLYIGKSKNLHRRLSSYFAQGAARSPRVKNLLQDLYDIQVDPTGSDLEAMLQEAARIRQERPARNRQRRIHPGGGLSARLRSILIIEPASPPAVLNVYLIRDSRMLRKIPVGPRGGGLKSIRRVLDDHFFFAMPGPTTVTGPDVDVEVVARWLAANRERAVAFDPTDFPSADDVTERLRWFLSNGSPFESDGTPVIPR